MDRWIGDSSAETSVLVCCCETRAKPKGKAFDFPVHLGFDPQLWWQGLGSDRKDEVADTSGRNEFPSEGARGGGA